ncbi:hypothetical protein F3Y22_tig00110831pilonHSYRG00626 [Hibiscus syriacus]|uniref:Uncharacterized protein n=1 Tax=Hibiscus syriacus TaxID=106335 RepID=A0A6A2ZM04_HIBSY|nr:hypothetical protein F3Y22_tig00110831pilonHSYRG00626 [Hibiscus syriacus]
MMQATMKYNKEDRTPQAQVHDSPKGLLGFCSFKLAAMSYGFSRFFSTGRRFHKRLSFGRLVFESMHNLGFYLEQFPACVPQAHLFFNLFTPTARLLHRHPRKIPQFRAIKTRPVGEAVVVVFVDHWRRCYRKNRSFSLSLPPSPPPTRGLVMDQRNFHNRVWLARLV